MNPTVQLHPPYLLQMIELRKKDTFLFTFFRGGWGISLSYWADEINLVEMERKERCDQMRESETEMEVRIYSKKNGF